MNEHWDKHFIANENLQQVNILRQIAVFNHIIRNKRKKMHNPIPAKQHFRRRPTQFLINLTSINQLIINSFFIKKNNRIILTALYSLPYTIP